mgnify:CR=1 FL=1
MSEKVVGIIQARMGSTRLPGKVLKKIKGKPMLQYTIESLRNCELLDQIIVATSNLKKDDAIEEFTEEVGVDLFRGSEHNVLSRYYHSAKENNADVVVRITGDCPLIDYQITDQVIQLYLDNKREVDFAANNLERTFPRGVDTAVFSFEALEKAYKNAELDVEKEHVVPYIKKTHSEEFNLINYEAEGKYRRSDIRITVDEEDDFKLIKEIINIINKEQITLDDVIDLLNEKPELLKINAHVEQKKVNFSK